MNPRQNNVCDGGSIKKNPEKVQTIKQFRMLHFIKQNFDMSKVDYTLSDATTIEMWDKTGNVAIITTDTNDPDYVEVEKGIYFCEI
ncbi:MAG TPA: hypothetical protein GX707_20900 [Epulopiscium sp.]|nr:hypothetical protein [Candidatus Epulonipiscium sp.]